MEDSPSIVDSHPTGADCSFTELDGYAQRWEELDEDIAVPGIVSDRLQLPLDPLA